MFRGQEIINEYIGVSTAAVVSTANDLKEVAQHSQPCRTPSPQKTPSVGIIQNRQDRVGQSQQCALNEAQAQRDEGREAVASVAAGRALRR